MIKTNELLKWYEEKRHYFKKFLLNSENNKYLLELIGLDNKITEKEIINFNSIEELEKYIKIVFDNEIKQMFKNKQPLSA
ncbi:hypothetical protein [Marinitoga aeolica]|jgi:uncharacterized membrane protein YgaE (UPF0421/DUF939 family)|uniref:Uncharacterized protein n=1 Tax=Marinitoga aeolica TaxID=2809031 RepID=A0ABY8PRA3_9BACT|nr:hypothetical protein [Marinitoga aeolica]WGS65146.1 hypothetical protein JRV97_00910 [Marinitoga aeolica]